MKKMIFAAAVAFVTSMPALAINPALRADMESVKFDYEMIRVARAHKHHDTANMDAVNGGNHQFQDSRYDRSNSDAKDVISDQQASIAQ